MTEFAPSGGIIRKQPRSLDLDRGFCLLKLHALKFCYWFAELLALKRIGNRFVKCTLCETDHLTRNAYAAFVQNFNGKLLVPAQRTRSEEGKRNR